MHEENFAKAVQYLELGYVIQSVFSDIKIKKVENNYYYCFSYHKNAEWRVCNDNEELFKIGEIKNNWHIL